MTYLIAKVIIVDLYLDACDCMLMPAMVMPQFSQP